MDLYKPFTIKCKDNKDRKFKNVREYYLQEFPQEYFELTHFEWEIHPLETVEDLNQYDKQKQDLEFAKCSLDFFYFAHKYVKILHPKRGLVPFICYKYQHQVINDFESYRFNMLSKFRQAGLTTLAELWGLWKCIFHEDQQIVLISKTDAEAVKAGEIIDRARDHLPTWLQPSSNGKWNDHKKEFHDTGSCLSFCSPERARGLAITYLIVDEAAFIEEMDRHWKAIFPTLAAGGHCIIISTVNGLGNWYERYYHKSKRTGKPFHVIDLDFQLHPEYNDPKWIEEQRSHLGDKGWQQEILRSFLGSGDTYIPTNLVSDLVVKTQNNPPVRRLFKQWANKANEEYNEILGADDEEKVFDTSWEQEGALWIWREPIDGQEYTIGVDTAEGVGEEGDSSCIQIIDNNTLEQVAEFYSNTIQPYQFAQVLNEIAIYYNHALVVIENMGSGGAVISNLQFHLYYDNLYFEPGTSKMPKAGVKVTVGNRLTILEALQQRCINKSININSRRLVTEITTFSHNVDTGKIAAQKGSHDDAIMAMAIALYVRDMILRDIPLGAVAPLNEAEPTKSLSYQEIKNEILEGAPKNIFEEGDKKDNPFSLNDDEKVGIAFDIRRKMDSLLREFGW